MHGQGVVHVVRGRADGGDLPETGLGAVPAAVPVALRVRGPVGGTAPGAGGRGAGRVQPLVRRRFRVLQVAQERVLLRPRWPPEPDVRVPVRARVPGRTGARDGVAYARCGRGCRLRGVRDRDGRAHRPIAMRVRDRRGQGRGAGARGRHALPVAGHRASGGLRVLRAPRTVHVRVVPGRRGPGRVHGARHECDAGPPGLRVRGRVRVRQGAAARAGRVPRSPQTPATARPRWLNHAGRARRRQRHRQRQRRRGVVVHRGRGRPLRRVPVAARAGHGGQQHAAHRRFRVPQGARLRDTAAPVANQLVHVPHPEPRGRVHRGRRRAQDRARHLPVRRGGQLRARLVRGVLARLDRAAHRRPAAAAALQDRCRRVPGTRVRLVHRHLDGGVQDAAHHVVHQRVRHAVQRAPRLRLQVGAHPYFYAPTPPGFLDERSKSRFDTYNIIIFESRTPCRRVHVLCVVRV